MRAAAAEARLANLAGPSSLVKMDPESDQEGVSGDEQPEVKDPHIATDQRRRDMETEMNEQERQNLRSDWEDFVKVDPDLARPPKRELEESSSSIPPPSKKPPDMNSGFGLNAIKQEHLRGLGMVQSTLSRTARPLGRRTPTPGVCEVVSDDVKPFVEDDTRWECRLCTYSNIADQGQCGRSRVLHAILQLMAQRYVRPVRTARFRQAFSIEEWEYRVYSLSLNDLIMQAVV